VMRMGAAALAVAIMMGPAADLADYE
jgi:hypothetical protein